MKKKTQLAIHRPEPVAVSIFGAEHRLRFLSRGDVLDIIRALLSSGFASKQGISGLKGESLVAAIVGCDEALSLALERSFPDFQEWGEVPLSGQVDLMSLVWEANDGPGIFENFSRMTRAKG